MPVMVYNSKLAGAVDTFDEIKEYNDNYEVTEDNKSVQRIFNFDASSALLPPILYIYRKIR